MVYGVASHIKTDSVQYIYLLCYRFTEKTCLFVQCVAMIIGIEKAKYTSRSVAPSNTSKYINIDVQMCNVYVLVCVCVCDIP